MLYLKSCPKCRGDMYLEKDSFGVYRQCLQCGYIRDLDAPVFVATEAVADEAHRRGRKRKPAVAA